MVLLIDKNILRERGICDELFELLSGNSGWNKVLSVLRGETGRICGTGKYRKYKKGNAASAEDRCPARGTGAAGGKYAYRNAGTAAGKCAAGGASTAAGGTSAAGGK